MTAIIENVFLDPSVPRQVKLDAITRVADDPGLPIKNPLKSFWLADLHPQFVEAPSTPLPSSAYAVVIGSGITGTSVARSLIRARLGGSVLGTAKDGNIVMLDAREIVGGATGRNGGHINDVGFGDYREIKALIGKEAALKIVRFRLGHLAVLTNIAKEEGLTEKGQVRKVTTASIVYDAEAWEDIKDAVKVFKEDLGEEADDWQIVDTPEGLKVSIILLTRVKLQLNTCTEIRG